MAGLKPYLDLCRISNLPTVWTNVLAGYLLAAAFLSPALYLVLALAMSFFYMAGMSFNDVCDTEFDRQRRPSRPIPAGRVSRRQATMLTIALFLAGMMLLALMPYPAGLAAGAALVLAIVAYDMNHKRNRFSVLIMAACRLLVFIVASVSTTGELRTPALIAGGIQFVYVLLISLIARYEGGQSKPFPMPIIPMMLSGIALLDGIVLAALAAPPWFLAGAIGALLTWAGQRYVRGD